ncbi:nucleoside transporter family [Eremomyces bilateralis CBS 781.70]|uniref:Nucleoside transporter family n=1 Tax=Eremomyces bilateralis CBS 781.70 TaxID=1392243 RepID=A0A6G1G3X2_9PEZI|nr:nucleoside transporter family [Eremomyces bilateralis CBS 781.70]KAF1812519.1 nucleoside transporter family [Eremomyces bilateralis CBS 781.70]
MNRLNDALSRRKSYEPLMGSQSEVLDTSVDEDDTGLDPFSWVDYSIFFLLGIAMLWAWNMFLAAGPYLQVRFADNDWLLTNFQSGELTVSTATNLGTMIILSKIQSKASYPRRIVISLLINMLVFTLLAFSTKLFLNISPSAYFGVLIVMVFFASLASGFCQNGAFAFASSFGRDEYMQAIMTGQGVAGLLPSIAQIILTLSVPDDDADETVGTGSSSAAFAYFLTATGVSLVTLIAFGYLQKRHHRIKHLRRYRKHQTRHSEDRDDLSIEEHDPLSSSIMASSVMSRRYVPLSRLFRKLLPLALAVFTTFLITMCFPVFTQQIFSVTDPAKAGPLLQNAVFIPLGFLVWNIGDFLGRVSSGFTALRTPLVTRPYMLFVLALARVVFIPLYVSCNINGRGAWIASDAFYLLIIQLPFGFTNGLLGASSMIGANEWVDVEEREAAGGFMGMCLVGGLTAGSLLSFIAARA